MRRNSFPSPPSLFCAVLGSVRCVSVLQSLTPALRFPIPPTLLLSPLPLSSRRVRPLVLHPRQPLPPRGHHLVLCPFHRPSLSRSHVPPPSLSLPLRLIDIPCLRLFQAFRPLSLTPFTREGGWQGAALFTRFLSPPVCLFCGSSYCCVLSVGVPLVRVHSSLWRR